VSGNTGTATTATARGESQAAGDFQPDYVGRFAPSPTGPLHLGSLVAAVGSFLDARKAGGRWLMRMEDLDTTRVVPGCSDEMLRTLEAFGLWWDGKVEYQSQRTGLYSETLQSLRERGLTFECSCSRRDLGNSDTGYPGTCRAHTTPDPAGPTQKRGPTATRFRVADGVVSFSDRIQGLCCFDLRTLGDPVIRRRDGAFAYQLAVVVDDTDQRVNNVVRGADLLASTAWQIELQKALKFAVPRYAHLPLIVEETHGKLSKSRRSLALDPTHAGDQLVSALMLLQHPPPAELQQASPAALLAWATERWTLDTVQGKKEIVISTQISQV
jgi:glutamyl-Q tRNA(Asp) synthetase